MPELRLAAGDFKVVSDGVAGKTCEAGFERVSVKAVPEPQSPLGEGVGGNTRTERRRQSLLGLLQRSDWYCSRGGDFPHPTPNS